MPRGPRASGGGTENAMALPRITIGILNRNGLARLRRCLPSILALDYPNREILVVDYGSTDGSVEFLRQCEGVRIIDLGGDFNSSRGRNRIAREASGAYVFMVDNDIEIPDRDLLRHLYERHRAQEDLAFLSPLVLDVGTDLVNEVGLFMNRLQRRRPISQVRGHGLVPAGGYYGNCVLFHKQLVEELGGFDEVYAFFNNDYDLGVRAHLYGYRVMIDTDRHVVHHGVEARTELAPVAWRYQYYLSSMLRIICKNYRLGNVLLWWPAAAGWVFAKALRRSWRHRSLRPLRSCLRSLRFFVRDLPSTLFERRRIQRTRRVSEDRFLRLRPQAF